MNLTTKRFLALWLLALVVWLLPALARAQDLPVVSANNPNTPAVIGWATLAYMFTSCVLRALSPDNKSLPFAPSVAALHWINAVGSLAIAVCLALFAGTPWYQAVGAGLLNFVIGLTHVGAAKGALEGPKALPSYKVEMETLKPPPPAAA